MLIGTIPKNVSKVHKKLADTLSTCNHKIYVEYPVKKLLLNFWENSDCPFQDRDVKLLAEVRSLSFDFYDETIDTIIEVQGEQHFEYNKFFHNNIGDFDIQRINDKLKERVADETGKQYYTLCTTNGNIEEFVNSIISNDKIK